MLPYSTKTIRLIGNCWDPVYGEKRFAVLIDNGKIVQALPVHEELPELPGVTTIRLQDDQVVFPGLVNLHTHIGYNILPIWESTTVWKNRFQWRASKKYADDIKGLINYIKTQWPGDTHDEFAADLISYILPVLGKAHLKELASFDILAAAALSEVEKAHAVTSEIQAVAGGTTILQQNLDLDDEVPGQKTFVIRNTDNPQDLGITAPHQVNSVVDFFRSNPQASGLPSENTSGWTPDVQNSYHSFITSVNNNNSIFHSTLVHAGEGKSGFYKGSQADPYSRKEIDLFIHLLKKDVKKKENLKKANLSITHGNGVNVENDLLLDFLRDHNISVIWSPVSNFLLYNDTVNIKKLLDHGINVCLGSDWSPSGSKHVLDELRFAAFLNQQLKMNIPDRTLLAMVTTNPLKALGISGFGSITKGANADLFVYTKKDGGDPVTELLRGTDAQVSFVMINGRIVFGVKKYFDQLGVDYQPFGESEGEEVSKRGVSINREVKFNLDSSTAIMDVLIKRYCTTVIQNPDLQRTRFMAADDKIYADRIRELKDSIH